MDFEKILGHLEKASHQAVGYLSERSNLEKIGKITAISVATYVVANKMYDAFFGPLGKVRGPFIAKFMDIPIILYDIPRGTSYKKFRDLHDTYGDVVRLGPKKIAVASKDLIKQVLVTDDLDKGPLYKIFQSTGKLSVFSATDKEWHKRRRRIIAPAFSIKYLNSLEPYMHSVTESLIRKVDKEIEEKHDENNYAQVDIWTLLKSLALDVIGETAFGSSFNMIEDNSHFVPAAINEEMRNAAITGLYPLLSKILFLNGQRLNPKLTTFLHEVIENRLKEIDTQRQDILQSLIKTQDAKDLDDRLTAEAIMSETAFFLIAGSETTSNTMGFIIFNLLGNPDALARLVAELDEIELGKGHVFDHEQIKHLTYFNAVINETLRLHIAAGGALVRITDAPTKLGHLNLEKDTVVMTTLYHTHTNSEYWPNPFEFKPERWIPEEQTADEFNDLEAFYAFSAGTRNCIGKNFALQEMRIALASFLRNFEILPIEQEMKDAENLRTFITLTVAKSTFDIKVKRRIPL